MNISSFITILTIACLILPGALHAMPRLDALPENFTEIRDPLLPPGYEVVAQEPDPAEIQREAIAARIDWPRLQLRGITHTGRSQFIAVIDRIGIVEVGDVVQMRQGDLIYTWRIDKIGAEGLTSTRLHVATAEAPQQPLPVALPQAPPTTAPQNPAHQQTP